MRLAQLFKGERSACSQRVEEWERHPLWLQLDVHNTRNNFSVRLEHVIRYDKLVQTIIDKAEIRYGSALL